MRKTEGSPLPFGAAAKERKVNFSVQVPMGKTCELLLYREGNTKPEVCFDMPEEEGIGEVRFLSVEEIDPEKYEYNFLIDGKVCTDPYAKEIAGREVFGKRQNDDKHGVRAKIQVSDYDWGEDRPIRHPWNEVVSYSIHVRGFTKHSSSKVLHRGTYQGVIEKIPYLKELGVNQIQCMPIYEFDECAKTKINYWGYGPAFYFAPKEAYSSDGCAVRELKDMVKACHKADIEVVLEMPFAAGISEQEAAECLRFYMMEYHVDGFVVNPYIVSWELLNKDPFLKGIRLMRKDDGFQNVMRRFLKGDENMVNDVISSLGHNSASDGKCNYITAQTGFTLRDLVSYDCKHNEENGENNNRSTSLRGRWKRNVVSRRKHSDKKYSYRISAAVDRPSDHHSFMRAVSGRTYVMEQQNIGIAPLFVQVFHNNMTDGISEISFTYDAGNFYVSFTEGEVIHKLPVGFGRAADGCVDLHGEHYLVATLGEFARDENDIPVLKLEVTFIEECVKRKAHIFFHEDNGIEIRWNETPGKKMILAGLSSITEELSGNFLYNSLLGDHNITTELLHRLMEQTIEPAVRGYLKRPEETGSIDTDE